MKRKLKTKRNEKVDDVRAFKKIHPPLPDQNRGSVFDFMWDKETLGWRPWMETVDEQTIDPKVVTVFLLET